MNRVLVATSTAVITAGLIAFITVEMPRAPEPTEDTIVAAALAKHRARGDAVNEAQIHDAYETLLHHGLPAEIVAICIAGNWSECSQFKSDEEEAISVAHKIKAPLGIDVSSQKLRDSYRAFIAHGASPTQARKCLVFFNSARCPL